MSEAERRYLALMAATFLLREAHEEETDEEMRLVDEMEHVWLQMPPSDRAYINRISAQIACGMIAPLDFVSALEQLPPGMLFRFSPEARVCKRSTGGGVYVTAEWSPEALGLSIPNARVSLVTV